MENNFNSLLGLLNGHFGIINLKKKKVLQVYKDSKLYLENASYPDFCDAFEKSENIDPKSYDRNMILDWFVKYTTNKTIGITFTTFEHKKRPFIVRFKYDEETRLAYFYATAEDSSNGAYNLSDPLTHLYLRDGIELMINNEFESSERRPFNIILIDVDNFKTLNDMYGHQFGDHVLKIVASKLKGFSKNCYASRLGGDEFMILDFESTSYDSLWQRLHKLLLSIREVDILATDNHKFDNLYDEKRTPLHTSVTVGAVRSPLDGMDYDTLFEKADKALYRGKRKGKNCFIIYIDEKHKNISVENKIMFDNTSSRDLLVYEKLILSSLEILEGREDFNVILKKYIDLFGEYTGADRITIYEHKGPFKDELVSYYVNSNVKEANAKYIEKEITETEEAKTMDIYDVHKSSNYNNIKDKEPSMYKYLVAHNIKAFFEVPLYYSDSLYGFLRIDYCKDLHNWSEEEETLIKIMGRALSKYIYMHNELEFVNAFSTTDNLTGLDDYKGSIKQIETILYDSKKEHVVLYTNIPRFGFYNDTYGYQQGDNILRLFTKSLTNQNFKFVGRLSGDHFVVLFEMSTLYDIKKKIEKLTCDFVNDIATSIGHNELNIQIGAYITDGVENNARACIDKARIALNSIDFKQNLNFRVYDNEINVAYQAKKEILNAFDNSIKTNKFDVLLQPKIDAKNESLIGAEALSRWKFNDAYLNPDTYIETLENGNLIEALDLYVFETVLKILSRMNECGKKLIPISVNVSKRQKDITKYIDKLEKLRKSYKIPAKYIEIELTESAFVNNYRETMEAIEKLKKLGYVIDMDDFGVGYSNLNLLSKGHFDVIKFDKSIVQGAEDEKTSKVLFHSIELAKSLGMKIVCEGVETSKQRDIILENGGEIIQGFYYSRPISIDDFFEKYLN